MPNPVGEPPLIVTALLGRDSFSILDGLRRRHFPVSLNKVPAHISLFHHLPGTSAQNIIGRAMMECRARQPFELAPSGLRFLGKGVAILYDGGELLALRAALAREWADWLTPQDRQPFKPHVTVQNKVAPADARALFEAMTSDVLPRCRIEGIAIWRYLGGPWESVAQCPFQG